MPARSPTGKERWQEKGRKEREKRKQQCLDDWDASELPSIVKFRWEFGLLGAYKGEAHGPPYQPTYQWTWRNLGRPVMSSVSYPV